MNAGHAVWGGLALLASSLGAIGLAQATDQSSHALQKLEPNWPQPIGAPDNAPNIVLILLDDVGFGDTSTFGGPAQTPSLSKLAAEGLRYNRFHTTGLCSPTRAALLSGRNHHRTGFGTVGEAGYPGYDGIWKKSTASIAEILRRHGYSTAAFGKWHNTPFREITPVGPFDRWPTQLGFEYYFGNMLGVSSQWEPELWRNTVLVQRNTAVAHYHYTTDIVDESIKWLSSQWAFASSKPYFMYVAPGAAHAPHHVPKEWIDKYVGKFDGGWDSLRDEIFSEQKRLKLIPPEAILPPRPAQLPLWSTLSAAERRVAARQMEVYAAFIEHTDHEIGRLIDFVRRAPGGDNTLVLYIVGDNGASSEFLQGMSASVLAGAGKAPDLENLGGPAYFNHYSAGWALAGNTPFRWGKGIASHLGATRNPLVVAWPSRIKANGELRTQFTHVNDVASTLLDVARIPFPETLDGTKQLPFDGVSFAYSFDAADAPSRHRQQYFEIWGNRALYKDGWMVAARHGLPWKHKSKDKLDDWSAYADDPWELYDLEHDFTQTHDLATKHPAKLKELVQLFEQEARDNDVYPLISGNIYGKMPAAERRKNFIFASGTGVPVFNAPQFIDTRTPREPASFRIEADVVIPDRGVEGVIVSHGSRFAGGFSLYVKDNRLIYEQMFSSGRHVLVSPLQIPHGATTLRLEIQPESGTPNGRTHARLWIDDECAAEAIVPNLSAIAFGDFGVGEVFGSAPTDAFAPPFKFTGTINEVRIDLE